jgi:hypothetical protein
MLSSDNNQNKNPSKPYNQTIPKSQQDGGRNLDDGCPEIEQAEASGLMDAHKGSIPEATATKVINGGKS